MTPEQICRSYDSSIIVRRWAATWLDFIVIGVVLFLLLGVAGENGAGVAVGVWFLLLVGYYPLLEGLTGRTLGKLICGLRVVDAFGGNPGIGKAMIRTLLRLIEVNPLLFGGVPAGIAAASSPKKQRLGDMAANTYVLKREDLWQLTAPQAPAYGAAIPTFAGQPLYPPSAAPPNYGMPPASPSALPQYPAAPTAPPVTDQTASGYAPPMPGYSAPRPGYVPPSVNYGPSHPGAPVPPLAFGPSLPSGSLYAPPAIAPRPVESPASRRKRLAGLLTASVITTVASLALIQGGRQARDAAIASLHPTTMSISQFLRSPAKDGWYRLTGCHYSLDDAFFEYAKFGEGSGSVWKRPSDAQSSETEHIGPDDISHVYVPIYATEEHEGEKTSLLLRTEDEKIRGLMSEMNALDENDEKKAEKWVLEHLKDVIVERDISGTIQVEPGIDVSNQSSADKLQEEHLVKGFVTMQEGGKPLVGVGAAGEICLGVVVGLIAGVLWLCTLVGFVQRAPRY